MLNSCDKYDKVKESFDEYYEPIKERYQEIIKINPNLIAVSSQNIIQGIFDNIDAGFGVPDDFCSVLRGEIEPVLRRLGMSPEEILQEFLSEQLKTSQPSISTNLSNTTLATSSIGTSSISPTIITSIIIAVVAIAGIGGTCAAGIICPEEPGITIVSIPDLVYPLNNLEDVNIVNFQWIVSSNENKIDYYKLEITDEDTGIIERKSVNDNLYSEDLDAGKYSWKVKAVDNTGRESKFSESVYFEISDTKYPNPPTLVSPNNNARIEMRQTPILKWQSSEDNVTFVVEITKKNAGIIDSLPIDIKSYLVNNLDIGEYSWKVKAVNGAGNESKFSNPFNFIIESVDRENPPKPTLVKPPNHEIHTTNNVRFEWKAVPDESGIKEYTIEVHTITGDLMIREKLVGTSYSTNLVDGDYLWKVRAIDTADNTGPFSDPYIFTIISPDRKDPPVPSSLLSEYVGVSTGREHQIKFGWVDVIDESGIKEYIVEIDKDGSLFDIKNVENSEYYTTLSVGEYSWRVKAIDTAGNDSDFSDWQDRLVSSGATIELDQKVYSWTDKVYITIVALDHNFDSDLIDEIGNTDDDPIKISTRGFDIDNYKLVETGTDTGIFTGEIILTGFAHDADGKEGNDTNPRTSENGSGPTDGFLQTDDDDGLTVSFEFSEDETIVGSSLIRWNIGEVQWLEASYRAGETGIVRVIDPDMNLDPEAVDNFDVNVGSDTHKDGIDITVTETNEATGIFEGTVFFTATEHSSGNRLSVYWGDSITAKYEDNTLPDPYTTVDELNITTTSTIESTS